MYYIVKSFHLGKLQLLASSELSSVIVPQAVHTTNILIQRFEWSHL